MTHQKTRHTEEQIAFALKRVGIGIPVADVCCEHSTAEATLRCWKAERAD